MTTRIRLLSANLLRDRIDPSSLSGAIDRHAPDMVVIQELGPEAAGIIADRFPNHDLHPATEYEGRGMATRFEAEFGTLSLPWREGSWARVSTDDGPLTVAGLHLLNPVDFPWWVAARRRGQQLDALFAWADESVGDRPLIVAGDMNASPAWPVYRRLVARWDDLVAGAATRGGTKPDPTWGWRPGWPRILRIDHVFGAGVVATDVIVTSIRGSDHAALVVDLELRSSVPNHLR
jgi:endonuclease/exonuclease/phosphatase (EEP) superfamily protein YafD